MVESSDEEEEDEAVAEVEVPALTVQPVPLEVVMDEEEPEVVAEDDEAAVVEDDDEEEVRILCYHFTHSHHNALISVKFCSISLLSRMQRFSIELNKNKLN